MQNSKNRFEYIKNKIKVFLKKRLKKFSDLLVGLYRFHKNAAEYSRRNNNPQFTRHRLKDYRCLRDWNQDAGTTSVYFWQDLWAARLIAQNNPIKHYDIGSRIDGFVANLVSFRDSIVLIDVRPLDTKIPGVDFLQADATSLDGIADGSVESISALCSLEHFGLGRYGDPIDPEAWHKAMRSIVRVLAPGGHAYIAVPIGWEHLEYNAHRIFYPTTIVKAFDPLSLIEFSVATGDGIESNVKIKKYDEERYNRGARFGLFHFRKK